MEMETREKKKLTNRHIDKARCTNKTGLLALAFTGAPEHATPRTRARVAKEAAIMAWLEAEKAEGIARAALEDAQAASSVLDMVLPDAQADPLQVALPAPFTGSHLLSACSLELIELLQSWQVVTVRAPCRVCAMSVTRSVSILFPFPRRGYRLDGPG